MPRKLDRASVRLHISIFKDQKARMEQYLPKGTPIGHVIRLLIDNYLQKVEQKRTEVLGPVEAAGPVGFDLNFDPSKGKE